MCCWMILLKTGRRFFYELDLQILCSWKNDNEEEVKRCNPHKSSSASSRLQLTMMYEFLCNCFFACWINWPGNVEQYTADIHDSLGMINLTSLAFVLVLFSPSIFDMSHILRPTIFFFLCVCPNKLDLSPIAHHIMLQKFRMKQNRTQRLPKTFLLFQLETQRTGLSNRYVQRKTFQCHSNTNAIFWEGNDGGSRRY